MKRSFFFIIILCTTALHAQDRPNVLLILSDDHSYPYLGCYGYSDLNTPNLDQLASEGILFNQAYTTAPQCVLSRASIMTGRNVLDIQMLRFSAPLDKDIITFPELMRDAGYYTGICGRTYHLDGADMVKESKEVFDDYGMRTFQKRVDFLSHSGIGDKVAEQLIDFLDLVPDDQPFFMWANYSDPHRVFTAQEFEPDPNKITMPYGIPDTKALREDLAAHLGEINRLDTRIGQLIKVLKDRGIYENTLIIFMGDNGAALLRGKGTLYDCGIHVPLIAHFPKMIKPGLVSDVLISGSDIGPTILDCASVEPDREMTGKSFWHVMQGEERDNHQYLFAVRGPHASGLPGKSSVFDLSRTVFNRDYRLIYNPMFHLPYNPVDFGWLDLWNDLVEQASKGELEPRFYQTAMFTEERPMFEFFDLRNDPYEFENLSGSPDYAEKEHEFKAALHKWMIIYRDVIPLPIPPPKH